MNIIPTKRAAVNVTRVMSIMLQQNGGAEGPMHFGSGNSPLQLGSSLDSHNGSVSTDTTKRPKILEVYATQGYARKNLLEDDEDGGDGSLPCTPELRSESEIDVSSCPAGDEVLESDTRQLISRFLRDFTGLSKPRWNESKELSTMKRVVNGVLEKHRYAYNGR